MTRHDVETALDAGRLRIRISSGSLWKARRNGATKTWKTRPTEFRIPIKYGFKSFAVIDHTNIDDPGIVIV